MRLIALKEFNYADKDLKVGEPFEANEHDAQLLKGWGKAKDATSKRSYQRRDLVSES
jgi:hypothetical protein